MDNVEQKPSRFWWIALGVVIGMLIGSPRLSISIQQCDSATQHQERPLAHRPSIGQA